MIATDTIYNTEYPNYYSMMSHDEANELRRWFNNWAPNKYTYPPGKTEWLTIEERIWTRRGRKIIQYIGTIGADHHERRRVVNFEIGAPPPPTFMLPVREKHVPSPPEPPGWEMRRHLGYKHELMRMMRMEWASLPPQARFIANVLPPVAPPPPRYRTN